MWHIILGNAKALVPGTERKVVTYRYFVDWQSRFGYGDNLETASRRRWHLPNHKKVPPPILIRKVITLQTRFTFFAMVALWISLIALAPFAITGIADASEPSETKSGAFPDSRDKPLPNWSGPVFQLSQDFPTSEPKTEVYPWRKIDFKTQWKEYMKSVLDYCLEGNIEADWVLQSNKVRGWYHAPWLHWGRNGREFIHGLTYEREARPGELAQTQTSIFQNWAVGMYNAPGGYVIGEVWKDPDNPNIKAAKFPDGTVGIKLLFTQASVDQVPYLKGAKEWDAYIYQNTTIPPDAQGPRTVVSLRLLQVDIAVRDSRADETTGWVFGTFTYNGEMEGKTPYDRLVPVGLMWGNDPNVIVAMVRDGAILRETRINFSSDLPFQHLGWAGRLNGPVDNPISSCLSCHSSAQWPAADPTVPPKTAKPDSAEWMRWFRNIPSDQPFTVGSLSLGYSLQLAVGIQNFYAWKTISASRGGYSNVPSRTKELMSEIIPAKNYPINRPGND